MKNNYVMVFGHPGHELRAFSFIKRYKPDVYILTTGGGAASESRLNNSVEIINSLGGTYVPFINQYSDIEMYNIFLNKNLIEIEKIKEFLKVQFIQRKYNFVLGDALEGFSPTHDFCRYLINSIVKELNVSYHSAVKNYDLLLDSLPEPGKQNDLVLNLTEDDFNEKYQAANSYSALKFEVDMALARYGREAFATESFREILNTDQLSSWNGIKPLYEEYGFERVKNSVYNQVITYEYHMLPIARYLLAL